MKRFGIVCVLLISCLYFGEPANAQCGAQVVYQAQTPFGLGFGCGILHRLGQVVTAPFRYRACAPVATACYSSRVQYYYVTPSVAPSAQSPVLAPAPPVPAKATPQGGLGLINRIRAQRGLRQLAHDANLAAWAAQNCNAQASYGLGHHVMAGTPQVSAAGYDETTVVNMWMSSPSHASIILDPNASVIGIAASGGFWTANIR